jgi:RNA polymerase sigma-70 factor (ECF subfamily)
MPAESTIHFKQPPGAASTRHGGGPFPPTRWSIVIAARDADDPAAPKALAELCRIYWRPVYSFLRRQGNAMHDAEDLTQGFFASLLERGSLATVDEARGRLRSFLLVALKRFAASEHARAMAQKRGGRVQHVTIDAQDAEDRYVAEPATHLSPDLLFEKQWALAVLGNVLARLRAEYAAAGREAVFEALKDRISTDGAEGTLADVAEKLRMNEPAVKVAAFRLRQRYRRALHEEIECTVQSPDEVREEIMHLFQIFSAAT